MSVVEFRNGYGRSFWQPERSDGARLYRTYYPSWSTVDWHRPDPDSGRDFHHSPKVYRRRWYAEWRAKRASAALRRRQLRQIIPTKSDGAADTGPAA